MAHHPGSVSHCSCLEVMSSSGETIWDRTRAPHEWSCQEWNSVPCPPLFTVTVGEDLGKEGNHSTLASNVPTLEHPPRSPPALQYRAWHFTLDEHRTQTKSIAFLKASSSKQHSLWPSFPPSVPPPPNHSAVPRALREPPPLLPLHSLPGQFLPRLTFN